MRISQEFIQELKSRTDIGEVIGSYVKLKKTGKNWMGLCPFHNEKSPSFSVSPENGFFHCFGCGAGGDVITFIRQIENLDYVEAVKLLAQRAGLTVPEENQRDGLSQLRSRICEANREAARFFHKQLYTPEGKEALNYLRGRGLTEKTIIHFGLGYSPKSRFELVNYLREKGFTKAELIGSNLANESQRGNPFDRFSDRVMFPIIDLRGNVIGFGGRIMSDIKPKYLNTAETLAFNKSRNLFALQFAKNKANGRLILVEGYMDVIALHQAGFENAVATLGTALTQEQAAIIKRFCDEVIICYDADEAGQKATSRAIGILRPAGVNIKVVTVPSGKDPDEFIKSYGSQGPGRFRLLLEKSGNDVEYRMNQLRRRYNIEITEQRVEFLTEAARLIAGLDNSIERDIYLSKLSQELNVEKSAIKQQVIRFTRMNQKKTAQRQQREIRAQITAGSDRVNQEKRYHLRAANAEESLLALLMTNPDTASRIFPALPPEQFLTSFNRKVYDIIKRRFLDGYDFTLTDISGEFSSEEVSTIAAILASHPRENDPDRAAEEYIRVLREEAQRLSPEQLADADNDTILQQLKMLREKKK